MGQFCLKLLSKQIRNRQKDFIVESAGGPIVAQTMHIRGAVSLNLDILAYIVRGFVH
jgi:hypothetical protein